MAGLFPQRWSTIPLSLGLLMCRYFYTHATGFVADRVSAPWGGHSVFPNIYRDMRHPKKYTRAINYTYIFTVRIVQRDISESSANYCRSTFLISPSPSPDLLCLVKRYMMR